MILSACNNQANPLNSDLAQTVSSNAYLPHDPISPCYEEELNQNAALPPEYQKPSPCAPKPCTESNVNTKAILPPEYQKPTPCGQPKPTPCGKSNLKTNAIIPPEFNPKPCK